MGGGRIRVNVSGRGIRASVRNPLTGMSQTISGGRCGRSATSQLLTDEWIDKKRGRVASLGR